MLKRVIAAAFGLAVVVVSSCSTDTCTPSSCDGCCTSDDKCVARPANRNDATCGAQGGACVDCTQSALSCSEAFTCAAPSDGGTGDAGMSTCDAVSCATGCCTTAGNCLAATPVSQSAGACGTAGQACMACPAGNRCASGVCTPIVDAGMPKFGDPCTMASQCASLGSTSICRTQTSLGAPFPGGYCSANCESSPMTICGMDAICGTIPSNLGDDGRGRCYAKCVPSASNCRPGYACYEAAPGIGLCYIANPMWAPDAGRPADKIGNDCTMDTDCRSPPDPPYHTLGFCIREVAPDGGTSPFTGGYCSADCSQLPRICGPNARCEVFGPGKSCLQRCTTPFAGQGECKANYNCVTVPGPDGGADMNDGFCLPNCHQPNYPCRAGTVCGDAGYCD